jgi:hypothetical protein
MADEQQQHSGAEPQQPPEAPGLDNVLPPESADHTGQHVGASRWMVMAAVIVFLCLVGAGITVAASSSTGDPARASHPADRATSATTAPTTRATAPASRKVMTKPVGTSEDIAKTALRFPKRLKPRVLRWNAGPGGKALAAVTAQLGTVMQAGGIRLYNPMKLGCTALAADIRTAQAAPPIPDAAMQRLYAKTLAGLSSAATDCRHAISLKLKGDEDMQTHVQGALVKQSMAEFAAGSNKLYTATAEIRALH